MLAVAFVSHVLLKEGGKKKGRTKNAPLEIKWSVFLSWASFPVTCILLTSFEMKVTSIGLMIYWGNWKRCMEGILKGDIEERVFFEKGKHRNPQEKGIYFFCCSWNNSSWCCVDFNTWYGLWPQSWTNML